MKSPEDPLLVAAPSLSKASIGDLRRFSGRRPAQTAGTKIGRITSGGEQTVNGMNGYEILADGVHNDSSAPMKVYPAVFVDDGSYLPVQGLVGTNVAEEYVPEFQAMARSLTRTGK